MSSAGTPKGKTTHVFSFLPTEEVESKFKKARHTKKIHCIKNFVIFVNIGNYSLVFFVKRDTKELDYNQ